MPYWKQFSYTVVKRILARKYSVGSLNFKLDNFKISLLILLIKHKNSYGFALNPPPFSSAENDMEVHLKVFTAFLIVLVHFYVIF